MSGNRSAVPGVSNDDAAERIRSMLTATDSLTVHTPGHRAHLVARHTVDDDGRVRVELPTTSCMAMHLTHESASVAMIELTDLAPTAVRDRVRGRGTLTGWLVPVGQATATAEGRGGELFAQLDLVAVELQTREATIDVDPARYAAARPDPLAAAEAELLCHLTDHHPRVVETLCRLVPPAYLQGVHRVRPLRLDRHGVVLRLEFPGRDRDARLRFPTPVTHPGEVGSRMESLLVQARHCRLLRRH